jgi:integrase
MSKTAFGTPMKDVRGYLKEGEIKRLIKYAKSDRDKLFIRLLWVTGCRISELVGDKSWYIGKGESVKRVYEPAKVKDIDFKEGVIYLNLLKRKQYPPPKHRVSLDVITLKNIEAYILTEKLKPNEPLFKFSRQRAFQIVREVGEEANISKVGAKLIHNHHFRHSNCVAYVRRNNTLEGLRKLQKRIGHASIETTAEYLQFGPESKQETEEIFGKW